MHTTIRTAARAVIVNEGKILLTENTDEYGNIYYLIPGGGQNHNETIVDALKRECKEEIGAEVEVGDILFVYEYIEDRHEKVLCGKGFHQVDMLFNCSLQTPVNLEVASEQDVSQIGLKWLDAEMIATSDIKPNCIRDRLYEAIVSSVEHIYLGEVD